MPPIVIGLGSSDWKDPLGLYTETPGLAQPQLPADAPSTATTSAQLPAGMRNNNPGNIKFNANVPWEGLVGPSENLDQGDPQAVFDTPEKGMRAAYKLALNKYDAGKTTANDLIASDGGWTPGNTQAAANIARSMGLGPDDDLSLRNPEQAQKFLRALVTQEHGKASGAYSDDMLSSTISAYAQEAPQPSAAAQAIDRVAGDPAAKGLARLAPPETVPPSSAGGNLHFRHKGQDKLNPAFQSILTDVSSVLGRDLTITSGYRSANHPVEARKKGGPGEHSRHHASDISMKGMSEPERAQLIAELHARGVTRFGIYKNSPDMLHVDMKDQTGDGSPWFMYDTTNRKIGQAPKWFQDVAAGNMPSAGPSWRAATSRIVIDADFKPNDPLGLYAGGGNPLQAAAPAIAPEIVEPNTDVQDPLGDRLKQLEAQDPGRYELIEDGQLEQWQADWQAEQPGLVRDLSRIAGGGVIKGVGHLVRGIGAAGSLLAGPTITELINPIFGTDYQPSNPLSVPAEWVRQYGEGVQQGMSVATKESFEKSQPDGDLLSPSTWTLGEDPSLVGYTALSLDVLGSLVPVVAAAILTGPMGAASVGGLQGGGAAEHEAHEVIDAMAAEPGELERQSAYYREQIASGKSPDEALAATKEAAGKVAFLFTTPISAFGGGLTAKILNPATQIFAGKNIVARIAGRTGLSALEEGSQEAAETFATRSGVNVGAGTDLDTTEGTFGDFVLGALAGGVPGAAGGAFSERSDAPTPAPTEEEPAAPQPKKGPLVSALEHGARTSPMAQQPAPTGPGNADVTAQQKVSPPSTAPDGAPVIGATVRVDADGIPPFMATVESYEGGEAVLFDAASGEVYQIPVENLTQIADQPGNPPPALQEKTAPDALPDRPAPAVITKFMRASLSDLGWSEEAVRNMSPAEADAILRANENPEAAPIDPNDLALEPQAPMAAESVAELPDANKQKPALERFPRAPDPGQRVIVDAPGFDRFAARVESYEDGGKEAMVVNDAGVSLQVPVENLFISNETRKDVEAEDLRRNPPIEREKATGPTTRTVGKHTVAMPDDKHARLYDLGSERQTSKKLLGTSQLDLNAVLPNEARKLADEFGVTPEGLGQMADDYRYRVQRAGREARSDLPVKMHAVNAKRLKQWQAEKNKAALISSPSDQGEKIVTPTAAAEPAPLDLAAEMAATSPSNDAPEPTQAQKEAGNYKLGHVRLGGLDISIENPAGSERKGVSQSGKPWAVEMKSHYGYFKGTVGRDKDHIDVFVRPGTQNLDGDAPIFVVDQRDPARGRFDEHKVMIGFGSEEEARRGYLENYTRAWKGLGAITETTLGGFKSWLADHDTTKSFASAAAKLESRKTVVVAEPAALTEDDVLNRMAEHHSIKGFLEILLLKPHKQVAAVIDRRGRLWEITGTSDLDINPNAGAHGHLFAELHNANIFSDHPVNRNLPYVHVTRYGAQIGLDADELTLAQTKALNALRSAAQRDGIEVITSNILDDVLLKGRATAAVDKAETPNPEVTKPVTQMARPKKPKQTRKQYLDRLENYFRANRVIQGTYGFDRVDRFRRDDATGIWSVTVTGVNAAGEKIANERQRDHATAPDERALTRWERENPVSTDTSVPIADSKPQRTDSRAAREKLPEAVNTPEGVSKKLADWGAENKLVSRERAAELRRRLKNKLNQASSGIDPEILAIGTELAAFHIEAGARRFASFASAIADDLGQSLDSIRPYLRAWYNGARDMMEDGGFSIEGMDDADTVRAELARLKQPTERSNEPSELGRSGQTALERAPAEPVSRAEEGRQARGEPAERSEPDLFGGEPVRGSGVPAGRSVADGAREPSAASGGRERASADRVDNAPDGPGDTARQSRNVDRQVDASQSAAVPAPNRPADFAISEADQIGQGGSKAKFRTNVAAIRLLRVLDEANRPATRDEQAVLAKWVGWGGLRNAFAREDGTVSKGWEKEAAQLRDLLTAEEFRAAEASTRNAHYTSPEVVQAIWSIVDRVGFTGGRVLEPSVGAGNFLGLMPGSVRSAAQVTGVELDTITGSIAKHLYPAMNIRAPMGFQDITVPDGYFDLAVGNPPFGSEKLYDAERRSLNRFSIHNYFIAKSLEGLRPGGVLAMVVTNYFMDARDTAARAFIAERADLIGAIRLPNNAFLANAGTEVTTDIVVFQKRDDGAAAVTPAQWVDVGTYRDSEGREVPLNDYFRENPDMMLGQFGAFGTMYRGNEAALVARDGDNLPALLKAAIGKLPANILTPAVTIAPETVVVPSTVTEAAIGSVFLSPDGSIHRRSSDVLGEARAEPVTFQNDKALERASGMIRVRDAFARLRRAQIDETAGDGKIANLRKLLNERYDAFVKAHGPINADANRRLFRDDPTWPQISALEQDFDKGISATIAKRTGEKARPASAKKTPIFEKRTQQPWKRPTSAKTAKDALALTMSDLGRVDLDAMAQLYGRTTDTIIEELGPLLYRTPAGNYETADQYLSGNVKQKLAEARRAAEQDPAFRRNIAALEDVIPADIEPVDINVKPGAPWLPANHVADFLNHVAEASGGKAVYSRANAKWVIDVPRATPAAEAQWSTDRASLHAVLDAVTNGQTITIRDRMRDGSTVVDQQATEAANDKVERVRAEWQRWLWQDDARREQLAGIYNDTFNTDVQRVYDGSHLTLPGKVGDDVISLRPHQLSFVWRTLQTGTALADHVVGAGKTFALVASIMEKRRTGQARKPVLTVPNHLVGQWAADFVRLYPGAKVLAATKKDFEAVNRKRLFARIATGDWDVVIVAHSSFGRIGVSPEFEQRFIEEQIADLEASEKELRAQSGEKTRNVAQLAKWRESLQTRLKKLLDAGAKDDGLTFDELGIDALYVDEAHEFKNLSFATSMTRVAGLGNPAGSQKAADLYMKVLSVLERTGDRNIVFATGTPLSNTMAEMYTVQRYLDGKALKALGLAHFDAWARVFGEVVSDWELSPSGQYKLNSRFAKFVNLPELMQRYLSFADVIANDDIKAQLAAIGKKLPLPKVKGGRPQNIVVPRSSDQAAYIGTGTTDEDGVLRFPAGSLVYRAENLPKRAEKGADNMLKVMSDARKAALDMRLVDPSYPDRPGSKVHIAADHMKRLYDRWSADRGTQLVFIDLSTPKKSRAKEAERIRDLMRKADAGDETAQEVLDRMSPDEFMALDGDFSVYDDLRQKLIDRGVPANQIAFIHDANTDLQKEELFGKVRAGTIRLLFGSTAKMGAGTNVQNRLVALHHLDAPWRPSDLEQRDGRGIRQGNELYAEDPDGFEIEILRYATENTLDARQWQTIEGKARFIGQVRKGGLKQREIDDIAGEAANAAEMKAAASGNPLILEEMDARRKLRRLEGQASEHEREQHRIKMRLRAMRDEASRIDERMPAMEADATAARAAAGSEFSATVGGAEVKKPGEFGKALLAEAIKTVESGAEEAPVGHLGEFRLSIEPTIDQGASIIIAGNERHDVHVNDVTDVDALGLAMRVINTVRRFADAPALSAERAGEIHRQMPALERQIGPWPDQADLDAIGARHREIIAQLRPAPKPQATVAPENAEPSAAETPVSVIRGDELGVEFRHESDMPALRRAASSWYDKHLRSSAVTMVDGTVVRFNQRGRNKTVSHKGDVLLRAVPAIRAIIEKGEVVYREPGDRPHVLERLVVSAPVEVDGQVRRLAVSIHRTADGSLQYDLHTDNSAGGPGIGARLAGGEEFSADSNEGTASPLNLVEWKADNKVPAGWGMADGLDVREISEADKTEIRDIVRAISGLDDVTFTKRIELPNGAPGWGGNTPTTAAGFYDPGADAITIAMDSGSGHVAYHEAFHRLQRLFLNSKEKAVLKAEVGRLRRMVAGRLGREAQAATMSQKELEAEAFAIYSTGSTIQPHKVLRAAWDRIRETLRRVRNFVQGRGLQTAEDVFDRARRGETSRRQPAADRDGAVSYSIAERAAAMPISRERVTKELSGKLTDLQPHLLSAVPLNYFTDLARPNMTAVNDYMKVKRLMDTSRGKKHAGMDVIAQDWLKYVRLGKEKAKELAGLMHDATRAGVDPSKTDIETTSLPGYDSLRKRYMAMAPAGRALFSKVRDAYSDQADELDAILLDNVRKAQEIAVRRAEDRYKKEVERIASAGLSKAARKDAEYDADQNYRSERTRAQWSMKARMTKMRIAFENSRVQEPYFPLARFGRYFVSVRDVDGTMISFSKREKAADRDRLAADLRKAYPTAKVEVGVTESGGDLRSAMDPRLVAEIEEILGGANVDSTVMDQIWQRYLESMPDLSTRKRFIHRKGTSGFDEDALRAFSSHMFHAAHQMGRLKYGLELQELTNNVADQARESDDVTRGMTLANELRKRHQWVMNPVGGKVAQTMTSAAFVWYLGTTPAAALVNMSQTPMIGIPVLGARFGGVTKAAAAIARAAADTLVGRGSVANAKISSDEKKAIEDFYESGLIDRTQAHDIAGVGEVGVEYSPLRARVMAVMSWMFHKAEVWNREVTALAAYRLAKDAGQNFTEAVDSAHDLTWKTHFDYSNASRPRLMQNDFAKVALVFRAYNINMLYRVGRDLHQTFKGETPQARKEARYQLAGILGMQSLLAGTTGVIGFNMAMSILGAIFGDDDDPMDFDMRFRADVIDILGPELGGIVLNGVPGHYGGVNLTDRIGMPDLWFRSPTRDLQGKDEFEYWIMNSLGASVSMLGDAWRGISLLKEGKYERGVEAMVPKFARDLLKSSRYLNEGLVNLSGDQILDPSAIDAWDMIAQAMGFTPAKISETYERNSALKNAEMRLKRQRQSLINAYALASRLDDTEGRRDVMDKIKRFNKAPLTRPLAITVETLQRSLVARERNARKREDGVLIQNPRLGRDLRRLLPEPVYR